MECMHIRAATVEDFPRMLEITHRALREIASRKYCLNEIDRAIKEGSWTLKRELIEQGRYFVAELNGRVEGGIGWDTHSLGEAEAPIQPLGATASLRGLYIDPDATGRGIGSALLAFCLDDIKTAGFEHVELYASFVAESIFRRYGFQRLCQQKLVLSDGTALLGLRMRRSLDVDSG